LLREHAIFTAQPLSKLHDYVWETRRMQKILEFAHELFGKPVPLFVER
jgi:hypothetical protein